MMFNGFDQWTSTRAMLLLPVLGIVAALPARLNSLGPNLESSRKSMASDMAINYLTKFGYLVDSTSALEAGNLRTEKQLMEAIRTLQKFAGIKQTGKIDNATMTLMRRSRCGVPDLVGTSERMRRYALQGAKWEKFDLTWRIDRFQNQKLRIGNVRSELSRAFRVWSDATRLTFTEVAPGVDADILISFVRDNHDDSYPFDGPGSVLAHAFFPGPSIGGDTHFDDDEEWATYHDKESTSVSLFAVAAHEFGHSLGLSHSSDQKALMYPYYQWFGADYVLPEDDKRGIEQLYGPKFDTNWATLPSIYTHPTRIPFTDRTPPTRSPQIDTPGMPNTCETSYDAISVIRRELFIFKDKYYWRLDARGTLMGIEPLEITRFWERLPKDLKRIDAVYERPDLYGGKIVFFIGKYYWVFEATQLEDSYPKPITDFGIPPHIEKIDAAMVWGHNGKTYFFSGKQYWRYDEADGKVELDYPRDMHMWKGVPYNIDAALQYNGATYFFKGLKYWKFNDKKMRVNNKNALLSAPFWMKCPDSSKHPDTVDGARELPRIDDTPDSAHYLLCTRWTVLVSLVLMALNSML